MHKPYWCLCLFFYQYGNFYVKKDRHETNWWYRTVGFSFSWQPTLPVSDTRILCTYSSTLGAFAYSSTEIFMWKIGHLSQTMQIQRHVEYFKERLVPRFQSSSIHTCSSTFSISNHFFTINAKKQLCLSPARPPYRDWLKRSISDRVMNKSGSIQ